MLLVLAADKGFFDGTNGLFTIGAQPSLEKLFNFQGNDWMRLKFFKNPFDQAIGSDWGKDNQILEWLYAEKLPDNIQTMIFPSLIVRR